MPASLRPPTGDFERLGQRMGNADLVPGELLYVTGSASGLAIATGPSSVQAVVSVGPGGTPGQYLTPDGSGGFFFDDLPTVDAPDPAPFRRTSVFLSGETVSLLPEHKDKLVVVESSTKLVNLDIAEASEGDEFHILRNAGSTFTTIGIAGTYPARRDIGAGEIAVVRKVKTSAFSFANHVLAGPRKRGPYVADTYAVEGSGSIAVTLPQWFNTFGGNTTKVLAFIETANQPVSAPSGWQSITAQGTGTAGGTAATCLQVFEMTGSGITTFNTGSGLDHFQAIFVECRDTSGLSGAATGAVASTASTTVSWATHTIADNDTLHFMAVSYATDTQDNQALGVPFGYTKIEETTDIGNGGGIVIYVGLKTAAGATGTKTSPLTTSSVQGKAEFALAPLKT